METAKGSGRPWTQGSLSPWPGPPSPALQGPCHPQLCTSWGRMGLPLMSNAVMSQMPGGLKENKFVCYTVTVLIKGDVII